MANYLGKWQLVPELCIYQQGEPPISGVYELTGIPGGVDVQIAWEDSEGNALTTGFNGPDDGSKQSIEAPGITHFSITRIDENTLDSAAFDDDQTIMTARRVVSNDGKLLTTVQTTLSGEGKTSNFQVYRRL